MFNKSELIADIESGMEMADAGKKQGISEKLAASIWGPYITAKHEAEKDWRINHDDKVSFLRFYNEFGGKAAGVRYGVTQETAQAYASLYRKDTGITDKIKTGSPRGTFRRWSQEKKDTLVEEYDMLTKMREDIVHKYGLRGWCTISIYASKFRAERDSQ